MLPLPRCLMMLLLATACALPLPLTAAAPAFAAADPSPFALERLRRLEADIELYRSLPSEWPGYDLLAHTLVFADAEGRAYLLNVAPAGSALASESHEVPGLQRIRRLDPEAARRLGLANDHVFRTHPLGAESVLLVGPLPHPDPLHEFITALHEAFHDHQFAHLAFPFGPGDESFASADDYAYTQVEAHLLARLLDERDPRRLEQGLSLYAALRTQHAAGLPRGLVAYRQGMDFLEGTAQYLGDQFYRHARPQGDETPVAATPAKLRAGLLKPQEATRSRYYTMGSALSHLMDRLMPAWKTRFVAPPPSFDSLLAEHLGPQPPADEVVRRIGPAYSIASRLAAARADHERAAAETARDLAAALERHRASGPTSLRLIFPDARALSQSGKWARSWDLPDGGSLMEAELYEVRRKDGNEAIATFSGSSVRHAEGQAVHLTLRRHLSPADLLVADRAFDPAAGPQRGAVRLEREGLRLSIRLAEVVMAPDGTLTVRVLEL